MRYFTFWDKVLIAGIVLLALLILLVFYTGHQNSGELYVEIISGGKQYALYPLNNFEKTIEIDNKFGYNEIKIYNGNVWAVKSDCAEKTEINESPINREGQMLVCLPHRLVIRIVSDQKSVDGVTY